MPSTPTQIGIHQAKTHFSKLLRRVEAGEEIHITRRGEVVARLVPDDTAPSTARPLGLLRHQWVLPTPEALVGPAPDLETMFYEGLDG